MKLKNNIFSIVIILFLIVKVNAQTPTIGLIENTETAFNGYTLFAPFSSLNTYLVNNCGELINSWESETRLATSVYLSKNADLYRTAKLAAPFIAPGLGGRIEQFDWEGNLIWTFDYSSERYSLHHDIEILPNGNILAIAWEKKTVTEILEAGKTGFIPSGGLWPDHIIEIQRGGVNDGEIIWTWHVWDHIIQDRFPELDNYGDIKSHPERIDLNFASNASDWTHLNSIAYNESLDQILVSSRHFSEIWIIDHSTSPAESTDSIGGQYGKGGDILYRWGNPLAYNSGSNFDQQLFGQHDATWIDFKETQGDRILLFNNGTNQSSIQIIEPPVNKNGFYNKNSEAAFGPILATWTYDGNIDQSFFSSSLSGATELENGNILISSGEEGHVFEIDSNSESVWEYIIPVSSTILTQGEPPSQNQIFKCRKYSVNDPMFENLQMDNFGPIELNPIDNDCSIYSSSQDINGDLRELIKVFPNPFSGEFFIDTKIELHEIIIYNSNGQLISKQSNVTKGLHPFTIEALNKGINFIKTVSKNFVYTYKIIYN